MRRRKLPYKFSKPAEENHEHHYERRYGKRKQSMEASDDPILYIGSLLPFGIDVE
jgi:hypothetical protein